MMKHPKQNNEAFVDGCPFLPKDRLSAGCMGGGETAGGLLLYTFAKFADEVHKFCLELGSLQPYPYSTVIPLGILSAIWTADGIIRLYGVLKNNEYKTTGMVGLAYRAYSRLKR